MSTPFTNKFVRKISLSSLLQQRAGLTTMQPIILCPRNSSVCMYFSHWMGLKVWQTTLGKANLLLLQTHPLSVPLPCHNQLLAKTTVVMEAPPQSLLLLYLLVHHPLPSQPTVVPSINILLLAVRPAQAQSNRRSMDHQPSYQLARNSRSLRIPSRTY